MRKVLVLLTSSYPFGTGEPFLANEMVHLAAAFDEIVIVSNDTTSLPTWSLPTTVTCIREPYALDRWETLTSIGGLASPDVRADMDFLRRGLGMRLTHARMATVLVTWAKARKFSRLIRDVAHRFPGAEVHAYAYWANDMAVAAALARREGWVHKAYCRAHGWDVYFERSTVGFLPFRRFLAAELDHYVFVSDEGHRYTLARLGPGAHAALVRARLGTPPAAEGPVARRSPFVVVSCSTLVPVKRVDLLARALGHVKTAARWVHVGDGPERGAVEAALADRPDNIRVDFLGTLPNQEVLELYRTLRPSLFVNVSASEGLPVSMMEAISMGVPVLGTDVGGVSELVSPGVNGALLAPDATPERIAESIDAFARMSDSEYHSLSDGAWRTWEARFDADVNYEAFVDMIAGRSPHTTV
jgi:glycosyltransferase involved in cell wall biosynthesis